MFDSFVAVLSSSPLIEVKVFTFIGEFLLALWLVTRLRRLPKREAAYHEAPTAVVR